MPQGAQRRYGGVDAERRLRERRERLLGAATELFGTVGYSGTTVQALCERAGLSKRYFYESFPNLEAALIAAYETATAAAQAAVTDRLSGVTDVAEAASVGIRAYYDYLDQHRTEGRLMYAEVLGVSPAVDAAYRRGVGLLTEVIEPLVVLADLPGPPRSTATAVTGLIVGRGMLWRIDDWREPASEVSDSVIAIVRALLRDAG